MTFAAPAMLWSLLLVIPVIVLYLIKVKRRQVDVVYLELWASLLVETRARSLFQTMKRWFSLLLQLLIVIAFALALGQPSLEVVDREKEHIVVLLDVSASMQTVEKDSDNKTRFALMMKRVERLVEERSAEDAMMIVAVSDRVEVLCPFDRNTLRLREAVKRAKVGNRSLDARRALAFAREVTEEKQGPKVVFFTDGNAGAVTQAKAESKQAVTLVPVGTATENVGIVRFAARKNTSLGTDYVLARIKNFGNETQTVQVELSFDKKTQKVFSRTLEPGQEISEKFQLTLAEGGTLRLKLQHDDAFALDNSAYAVVRPNRLRRVLLVTPETTRITPFQIAFQSMQEVISEDSAAVSGAEYAKLSPEERRADVTIALGKIPPGVPKQSNLILIDTELPSGVPAELTGREDKPRVWDWDRDHLLNRFLNWKDLPIPSARKLKLDGGRALVNSYDGPLVAAFDQPDRRLVYVAFDMTASLFPFRLAFPMLLRNAIAWFELSEDVLIEPNYRPGQVIAPLRRVKAKAVKASYFDQGGAAKEVEVTLTQAGRFFFTDTEGTGPYMFEVGETRHATSVNLFDLGESSIAPLEPDPEAETATAALGGKQGFFDRELWPYLVLLGLLLWTVEWATYHRRLTE